MEGDEYFGRSRLFRRLTNGAHGHLIERYALRLSEERLARHGVWRCLNIVGGLLDWIAERRCKLAVLDENMVEPYLRRRAQRQTIQPGDRAALRRWLSVLREAAVIAPATPALLTPYDEIFVEFDAYLRTERGLAPKSIVRHLPVIRRFLREVCPAGTADLDKCGLRMQRAVNGWRHLAQSATTLVVTRLAFDGRAPMLLSRSNAAVPPPRAPSPMMRCAQM